MYRSRAGCPSKDMDEFQQEILTLFKEGRTANEIVEYLSTEYNFQIGRRTIQRRLKEWGVSRRIVTRNDKNLESQVKKLFNEFIMTDQEMQHALQKQGFNIGLRGLRHLRRRLGLRRRSSPAQFAEIEDGIRSAVQQDFLHWNKD